MDWTWGIQPWPAIALYQQEIVGTAIGTWQLLHSISMVPKERSQLLVFHVFAMSLFVYLRDLSTFFRIPTHSRSFRFLPVTGVPESLRWDAINQGAKHGDKTWRSHANSCWNHPFFGHIQTVGPRWKEANWEMKGMSIESFSNGLTILAPSSRMSCTCDMNQWSFQVRYTSDFARPPWQNLQVPSICHILWRPGSDFVTDIPYHRWDHELYYDSDPNCWMQAPVMAYRVVQRGRVLWNLVIFSFQVWFRYGECVCVYGRNDAIQHVGFADLCGSDSCKITGPVLGPGSHQVWISSIISAHKALLTIDDQLCGQLGLLIVNFL